MSETTAPRRRRVRLRTLVQLLLLAFVVHLFVLPQIGGARAALSTVRQVSPLLIAVALGLEAGSLLAYAALTRTLLPGNSRPPFAVCFAAVLASTGVSHVMPGGAATTAAVNYRLFDLAKVAPADLGFALGAQAIGSAAVLNMLLWFALLVSIPASGFHPIYATAAAVGAVLMITLGATVIALMRGHDRAIGGLSRLLGRLPRLSPEIVEATARRVVAQLAALLGDRRRLRVGLMLATANWLLDAAALWVCLAAFGHSAGVIGLLVAYGLANVMSVIPFTPGGLGIMEAVLIPTLVGFGNPASVVAVGVVAYRLVSFWLPIPTGLVAYLLLERRLASKEDAKGARIMLARLAEGSTDQAQAR